MVVGKAAEARDHYNGPADHTPGGFRNVRPEEFEPRHVGPTVMTTRAKQLAMYVAYEGPVAMVADGPDTYAGAPGADFLAQVPATWAETRVPPDRRTHRHRPPQRLRVVRSCG